MGNQRHQHRRRQGVGGQQGIQQGGVRNGEPIEPRIDMGVPRLGTRQTVAQACMLGVALEQAEFGRLWFRVLWPSFPKDQQ